MSERQGKREQHGERDKFCVKKERRKRKGEGLRVQGSLRNYLQLQPSCLARVSRIVRGLTITVAFMIHMLSERGLLSAPRMKSFGLLSQFFFKNSKLALSARMLAVNRYSRLSFVLNMCTELALYLQFMVLWQELYIFSCLM